MMKTKIRELEKIDWQRIYWFVGLTAIVGIVPYYIHNQFITGPLVNAALIIGVVTLGTSPAITIGLVPSVVALSSGLLPITLAPMVPFIMISNAILVLIFAGLRKINFWTGIGAAALIKYLFLYITSSVVVGLITQQPIAEKASAMMMSWPQLATALVGGVIAWGVLRIWERYKA
jgi:hypothetical protein